MFNFIYINTIKISINFRKWITSTTLQDIESFDFNTILNVNYETIDKFIHWICEKFDMGAEDNLIRDFQKETNTFIEPEKQIKKEEREKEWDLER